MIVLLWKGRVWAKAVRVPVMNEQMPIEELISGAARDAGGWLGELPVALLATSADGTIVRWNRAAQELLGYEPPQVVGRHIADLLHPGADRSLGRSLWETAATGRGVMGTVTAWHHDGHPLELEIWACPVPGRQRDASRCWSSPPMRTRHAASVGRRRLGRAVCPLAGRHRGPRHAAALSSGQFSA